MRSVFPAEPTLTTRREFVLKAAVGTTLSVLGGLYVIAGDGLTREARAQQLPDGRPRLPPGQRVLTALRPMGGEEGDPSVSAFELRVTGEVDQPLTLDFQGLLGLPQVQQSLDVHCVTGWSVLGAGWEGVRVASLAAAAGIRPTARYAIFEGANGYTANVPLRIAMAPESMIAHKLDGQPLAQPHGAPARAVIPALYFWKSAKWITGVRFTRVDEPGYWETRGYHNHGDPWREERYG